jgi:hypothetical protein
VSGSEDSAMVTVPPFLTVARVGPGGSGAFVGVDAGAQSARISISPNAANANSSLSIE